MNFVSIDVGIVPLVIRDENGSEKRVSYEVDFVANKCNQRYYIQFPYRLDSDEKIAQEQNSLEL